MESTQASAAALRAFRLLECLARHPDGLPTAALMRALDLPKQTVHRIVKQLQLAGLVFREPGSRKVQLGSRLTGFATNVLMNGHAYRERRSILMKLAQETGETCNLTALVGSDIVYLDRIETAWPLRVMLAPGSHVPLHATASGKLLLSLLPKAQRNRLLRLLPLRPLTPATIVEVDALARELEQTRKRRIGINRDEHLSGLIAVAVPVMLARNRAVAAIAIQAPVGRMTIDQLLAQVPRMQAAAAQMAATFCV